MARSFSITALALILVALVGCSSGSRSVRSVEEESGRTASKQSEQSGQTAGGNGSEKKTEPQKPISSKAFGLYVEGVLREQVGRLDSAALFYRYAWQYFPESYEIGYSLARVLYQLGEPQLALQVAGKTVPKTAELWELSAAAHYELRDNDSVMFAYRNVVRLNPENATAFNFLAGTYRLRNQLDSAAWAYRNLARLVPDNFRPWQELGRIHQQRGDLEAAGDAYHHSVALDSSRANIPSLAGLGEIFAQTGPSDSARFYYLKALEADPSNELVHMLLVTYYIEQDSLPAALQYSERLAELAPDNMYARRRLGLIYLDLDSLQKAENVFSDLIKSGDHAWFNYSYLGEIDLRNDRFESAVNNFQSAASRNDTVAGNWLNLGLAHRKLKENDAAIDAYVSGLRSVRDPRGQAALYFGLAVAYEQEGLVDSAITTFEELLKLDSNNAQALNYLGYMLADRNIRLEYARDLIARAVDQDPRNAAFLDSYGWVYYRLGDFDKAVDYLSQAVALDSDPVIFDHLGDAYHAMGDTDSAREWWQRALELSPENESIREKLTR